MSTEQQQQQLKFAIDAFERIHPNEFQRRFLTQNTRHDGREFKEFRKTGVVKGAIGTAQGSATIRLGNTTIVCGIKAEVSEPQVTKPAEGYLVANVELPAMCSSKFRPNMPSTEAQVLSEHVQKLFEGNVVDLNSLCIEENKVAWCLYCDLVCLTYDGNVLDACVFGLLTALENLQLPKVQFDTATGVVSADKSDMSGLTLKKRLFSSTFSLIDDEYLLADADDSELALRTAEVSVIVDQDGGLVNILKRGSNKLTFANINECIDLAVSRKDKLVCLLD